jgi:hypothetical protein
MRVTDLGFAFKYDRLSLRYSTSVRQKEQSETIPTLNKFQAQSIHPTTSDILEVTYLRERRSTGLDYGKENRIKTFSVLKF